MKRDITILLVLLLLMFRQWEPYYEVREPSLKSVFLVETNFFIASPGTGFVTDNDKIDPVFLSHGLPINSDEEQFQSNIETQRQFACSFLHHPNLLLIDRPPPAAMIV